MYKGKEVGTVELPVRQRTVTETEGAQGREAVRGLAIGTRDLVCPG